MHQKYTQSHLMHFSIRNKVCETYLENASYCNNQEKFVANILKIQDAQNHSVAYDFIEIVLVRKMVYPKATSFWDHMVLKK